MGGKSSSGPAPGESVAAAMATAQSNQLAAERATAANRVDQVTPWGSLTYQQNAGTKVPDPAAFQYAFANWQQHGQEGPMPTPDQFLKDSDPTYTQTLTLTPETQAALAAQQQIQNNQSQLALQLQQRAAQNYSQDFKAPQIADYLKDVKSTDQTAYNLNDFLKGVPGLDYNAPDLQKYLEGAQSVDTNIKTLDPEAYKQYAQAAYDSANSFLAPQYAKSEQTLRDNLALQGLNPMSQASGAATGSFYDSKNQAYNQLANQSILTGNTMANNDYASYLSGMGLKNNSITQDLTNRLQTYGADLTGYTTKNQVAQQGFQNANTQYNAALTGQAAQNTAISQAYAQAMAKYGAAYDAAYAERALPLNEMNAMLNGQQVTAPTFNGYYQQQVSPGANLSGAVAADQANSIASQNAKNAASANTAKGVAGLAGAGIAAASGAGASTIGVIGSLAAMF